MANNLKYPLEDPPSLSSNPGKKEIEFVSSEEDEEGHHQHTIFSSEEDEPEDPPPRKKRLSEGISTNVRSKRSKKMYTQGEKMGSDHRRLFSERDEIVLLQSVIDYKGKNPLADKGPLYESIKGSFSFDVKRRQFTEKLRNMRRKYTTIEEKGEEASVLNPHQKKCFQLSKAVWGDEGIAFESANGKSNESQRRVMTKKLDLVSSPNGKNVQGGSKRGDMDNVVMESDWDESSFFLGMDFLKKKWSKVLAETKKKTQEKMKKLHADELECKNFEEKLKAMKDQCAHDKVELLNEVTSLIIAAD